MRVLPCCMALLCLVTLPALVQADIVVNTASDEDTNNASCSLREAITAVNTQANYNGCVDSDASPTWSKVTFAIAPNAGEQHLIGIGSQLPKVQRSVFIDATTQSGTTCTPVPNLRVRIANTASASFGLWLGTGATGSTIHGLAFTNFASVGGAGIAISSDQATVGCVISGMDATGALARPNFYGIQISGKNATIGEASVNAWFPNLISANKFSNIQVGGDDAVIAGNYIGVDNTGLTPLQSGYGIQIVASGTRVGTRFSDGPVAHQRNIIGVVSNKVNSSVDVDLEGASDTIISGNYVGVGVDGKTVLPIDIGAGIVINSSNNALIGCDGLGSFEDCRNVIAVTDYEAVSSGNGTTALAIVNNFINVAADGVTPLANGSAAVTLASDSLVARNVIRSGSAGTDIALYPPNDHSPTSVFLNAALPRAGGVRMNSSDNCLDDSTANGVLEEPYGTATVTPTTFGRNWWGAANGPRPAGSGAFADAAVATTPFSTKRSPYCGFDRIFANGFDG